MNATFNSRVENKTGMVGCRVCDKDSPPFFAAPKQSGHSGHMSVSIYIRTMTFIIHHSIIPQEDTYQD